MRLKSLCLIFSFGFLAGCSSTKTTTIMESPEKPIVHIPAPSEYSKLINGADSEHGLFSIHRKGSRLYFEIPDKELGNELLLVTRIARAQAGTGFGGQRLNNQVIRWEKTGDRIILRSVIYSSLADSSRSIATAVQSINFEPIIASFDIITMGPDSTSSVIDVTRLFTTDVAELSPRQQFGARRVDASRSYVERARSFPDNVEIQNVLTMERTNTVQGLGTISTLINHSMVRLSSKPMMPRIYDERIGYFSVQHIDYGRDDHRAERRRYVTRWRLEKKYPDQELSEPIKPIVFYVDRAAPSFLHEYIIQGVNDWQVAFEQAGFKNAIIGKMAPTAEENPDWSPEDARYSNIRWVASPVSNARGPHINDPRTGEIITSSIELHHNVMNLLKNWYFVQAAAVDDEARNLPLSNELMGRLVRYVVAHEVGHTLGLQHNMKASSSVPTDSLRSPTFTNKYGTSPSIMDYARMNYVAQPGDNAYLFPIVSVYDKFAIEWGYKPVADAKNPDEERTVLNEIASRQKSNPMLQFGSLSTIDPTQQREALGDNHVRSSQYGIENLKLIMDTLVESASIEGENFRELNELYNQIIQQRNRYLGHVTAWIGGVMGERKVFGQNGPVYTPVPKYRQLEAMDYLIEEAFQTPAYLLDHHILSLIEPTGSVQRVMDSQHAVLQSLLSEERITRMVEMEALNGDFDIYTVGQMMDDVTGAIWAELDSYPVTIDLYRRNLQRSYLEVVNRRLSNRSVNGELRALLRGNLNLLLLQVKDAEEKAPDRDTQFHLSDVAHLIGEILKGV